MRSSQSVPSAFSGQPVLFADDVAWAIDLDDRDHLAVVGDVAADAHGNRVVARDPFGLHASLNCS